MTKPTPDNTKTKEKTGSSAVFLDATKREAVLKKPRKKQLK